MSAFINALTGRPTGKRSYIRERARFSVQREPSMDVVYRETLSFDVHWHVHIEKPATESFESAYQRAIYQLRRDVFGDMVELLHELDLAAYEADYARCSELVLKLKQEMVA